MPPPPTKHSWLLAAWPGMGNVAIIAAGHLVQKLSMKSVAEIPLADRFDLPGIDVIEGVVETPRMPRAVFYRLASPLPSGHDLTVLLAEAQPTHSSYPFCHAILDRAREWNVDRLVTFASMASSLHPTQHPRVFGAATRPDMVDEMRRLEVHPLKGGQIGGMNGLMLGAASERNLSGLCLLGEIPFFAAGVSNPKAAQSVLDAFALLAGFEIDMEELSSAAEVVDAALVELLERMESGEGEDDEAPEFPDQPEVLEPPQSAPPRQPVRPSIPGPADRPSTPARPAPGHPPLDDAARARIERLFEEAREHRSRAVALKKELDRLGVFAEYENRFLDLFRRAE